MRQKRYESVEKMLDLLDVARRIGPKFPLEAMFLDPHDPEWDDDMTYLYVERRWGVHYEDMWLSPYNLLPRTSPFFPCLITCKSCHPDQGRARHLIP